MSPKLPRRELLKLLGVTGAGLGIGPKAFAQEAPPYTVLGYGTFPADNNALAGLVQNPNNLLHETAVDIVDLQRSMASGTGWQGLYDNLDKEYAKMQAALQGQPTFYDDDSVFLAAATVNRYINTNYPSDPTKTGFYHLQECASASSDSLGYAKFPDPNLQTPECVLPHDAVIQNQWPVDCVDFAAAQFVGLHYLRATGRLDVPPENILFALGEFHQNNIAAATVPVYDPMAKADGHAWAALKGRNSDDWIILDRSDVPRAVYNGQVEKSLLYITRNAWSNNSGMAGTTNIYMPAMAMNADGQTMFVSSVNSNMMPIRQDLSQGQQCMPTLSEGVLFMQGQPSSSPNGPAYGTPAP